MFQKLHQLNLSEGPLSVYLGLWYGTMYIIGVMYIKDKLIMNICREVTDEDIRNMQIMSFNYTFNIE